MGFQDAKGTGQPLDGHGPEPLGSLLQWRGGFSRRH